MVLWFVDVLCFWLVAKLKFTKVYGGKMEILLDVVPKNTQDLLSLHLNYSILLQLVHGFCTYHENT